MKEQLESAIRELALPLVESQGLEIWGLELSGNPPKKLVLYVDSPQDGSGGQSASIEQCEAISRQLGLALDVEDRMPGPWTLEVSSPGLERRFFNLAQMRPYVGDMLEVSLLEPAECGGAHARTLRGRLAAVGDGFFELEPCQISGKGEIIPSKCDPCRIPWENCRLARRMFVFTPPQKPGKKKPG